MAVVIRLARHGRKKLPFYRIVAADKQKARDGRYIEMLGTFDPLAESEGLNLKEDRVKHWVSAGANPSPTVATLIEGKLPGYLKEIEEKRLQRLRSARAKRKTKAAA